MKKDIHPENYRPVIFLDTSSGERFLLSSTVDTKETAEWEDGEEYPLAKVEMSSASHPFYTGVEKVVDTAGRVEKFKARFAKAQERQEKQEKKSKSASAKAKADKGKSKKEDSEKTEKTEDSEEVES
ncbi:MAG: type B 50S ribosomal protein L31 [Candidatus Paceibacterota bacterium]